MAIALTVLLASAPAYADTAPRQLAYSSTSYDDGWVEISVDSTGRAAVSWSPDPFLHAGGKPWETRWTLSEGVAPALFAELDKTGFAQLKDIPDEVADAPADSFREARGGKEVHRFSCPSSRVPAALAAVAKRLNGVYKAAKARHAAHQ